MDFIVPFFSFCLVSDLPAWAVLKLDRAVVLLLTFQFMIFELSLSPWMFLPFHERHFLATLRKSFVFYLTAQSISRRSLTLKFLKPYLKANILVQVCFSECPKSPYAKTLSHRVSLCPWTLLVDTRRHFVFCWRNTFFWYLKT